MLSSLQRRVLECLRDNDGEMTFNDMKFDLSPHTSPQGLGRCLTTLSGLRLVNRFNSWNDEESVNITLTGEITLEYDHQR